MGIRAHVIFHGRVQGVWFRATTRDAAKRIGGLTGWVRNLPDGTVEAIFEGAEEKIAQVINACKNFRPPARVDRVEVENSEATGEFSGFEVSY